jgi:hypothetical protein
MLFPVAAWMMLPVGAHRTGVRPLDFIQFPPQGKSKHVGVAGGLASRPRGAYGNLMALK